MAASDTKARARGILLELYHQGFIETVFNAADPARRASGWTLKSGTWSPWYINLRPLGAAPALAWEIARAMARLIADADPEVSGLVGIDMAGVPLAALVSAAFPHEVGRPMPFLFTRPLPGRGKVRSPEEAREVLAGMRGEGVSQWGGHCLVEGRMHAGDKLLLLDDVSTSFGSKAIAREWVRFESERQGIPVQCSTAAVIVDREQGACEQAAALGMQMFSLLGLKTEGLEILAEVMQPTQHAFLSRYQTDPTAFQDAELRGEALARARADSGA